MDLKANTKITDSVHEEFDADISGIGCFKGIFSLQVKDSSKP